MVATTVKKYTPAEYLERERQSTTKSEFINGAIVARAGASANHNSLTGTFHARLLLALEDSDYSVFMSDMRVWLPAHQSYTYPDVLAVATAPHFTDSSQTALTNPCLIVEVSSASTEAYDKTDKFRLYRSIPEFEEYVLVDQTQCRVEQYTKLEPHRWLLTEWVSSDDALPLKSVGVELSLADLYKRVRF